MFLGGLFLHKSLQLHYFTACLAVLPSFLNMCQAQSCMETQIYPHPHLSQQRILTITAVRDVNPHLMNMYH